MNQYLEQKQGDFQKIIDFFKSDISSIRTGRANPAIFEKVQVESYGTKSPLNSLANISVSDSRSMVVSPWDKNILKNIEKAITEADLGVNISNEGDKLRVTFPQVTEEDRRNLVKKLNEKHENARIKIRQTRDEIKEKIEDAEKGKEISEDDKFRFLKEMDEEVAKANEELKEIRDKKESEIMAI